VPRTGCDAVAPDDTQASASPCARRSLCSWQRSSLGSWCKDECSSSFASVSASLSQTLAMPGKARAGRLWPALCFRGEASSTHSLRPPCPLQTPGWPPEWLHSPSAHCTMEPVPSLKLGMHRCVAQKSDGVLDGGVLPGALGAGPFGGLPAVGAPTAVWRQSRAI